MTILDQDKRLGISSESRVPSREPRFPAARGFSWLIATLLLLCLFINYIDRQTLSVLVRFLPANLKMSNLTYGRIQSLFLLAYSLAMPLAGWTVDRLGTRTGLAVTVAIWSVIEFLHGTARRVTTLGAYRFLLGVPEAAGLPAVSKAAAEHASPHGRAALIGIAMFGLGMGSTLAPPVVAFLTIHFNWSWAFYATGLAGIVWVAVWLIFYRAMPEAGMGSPEFAGDSMAREAPVALHAGTEREFRPHASAHIPWSVLLRDQRVIGLTLSRAFADSAWWFYLFWIPPFLNQARGLDLHQMGILGWIPYFFASIGSVVGGYASGYFVRHGSKPLHARRAIMWACACVVPFTSLVVGVSSVAAVLALLAIATFFIQGFFANVFSLPADLFPHQKVASVFGLNTMAGGLAGFLTVQGAGYLVDRFSYVPVFLTVAFFLPAGALCAQLLVPSGTEKPESIPVLAKQPRPSAAEP